jgi:hypothetical protein
MPSRRARRAAQRMQARQRRNWMIVGAAALSLPFAVTMIVMGLLR